MSAGDRQEQQAERRLKAAAKQAREKEIALAVAKAQLDQALRETRNDISRRRAASITGLTAGRVQQIVGKA